MRKQVQVYYAGRVQGVGFRYSVRELACGYEVTGYVRNLPDGRVELVAEGEESEVQAFLDAIQTSHLASHIRQVTASWGPTEDRFKGFEIVY
ncbi:MAG: acylphosphatase [Verrucomicrobiae bacterium]|nr:acylphosphatase [Verrucomicrobiae bacterium]MCX7916002.1 acylphosphatase [Verrucomicrobiae bacterium]